MLLPASPVGAGAEAEAARGVGPMGGAAGPGAKAPSMPVVPL